MLPYFYIPKISRNLSNKQRTALVETIKVLHRPLRITKTPAKQGDITEIRHIKDVPLDFLNWHTGWWQDLFASLIMTNMDAAREIILQDRYFSDTDIEPDVRNLLEIFVTEIFGHWGALFTRTKKENETIVSHAINAKIISFAVEIQKGETQYVFEWNGNYFIVDKDEKNAFYIDEDDFTILYQAGQKKQKKPFTIKSIHAVVPTVNGEWMLDQINTTEEPLMAIPTHEDNPRRILALELLHDEIHYTIGGSDWHDQNFEPQTLRDVFNYIEDDRIAQTPLHPETVAVLEKLEKLGYVELTREP